jgi:ribonuclease BN (tRNA processing enzyme)
MRVYFLGTGGYHPNERRHTAGVMLPEIGVIFDAGTGFFRVASQLETDTLEIFFSHAHSTILRGSRISSSRSRPSSVKRARIHGKPETLEAVRKHLFAEEVFPIEPPFEYVALTDTVSVPGGGVVRHWGLKHPGGSIGYRLDFADRSMAYITDTTVDRSYEDFVRGVDLLIHECYFPDDRSEWSEKTGHSHTSTVATLAKNADVGRLLLVHIDPTRPDDDPIGLDAARAIFPNTDLAEDRMTTEF